MQGAGQDTPGVGQCQHILGLEAEAEYPGRGWKTQGPPGGRGGGRQGTTQVNELYVSVLSTPTDKFLVCGKTQGNRKSPSCLCGV